MGARNSTQHQLADEFVKKNRTTLKRTIYWGKYVVWDKDKNYWRIDESEQIRDDIRWYLNEVGDQIDKKSAQSRLGQNGMVSAIERLVRSDQRIVVSPGIWDPDPMHLNTPSGVVDLASGSILPHNPEYLITKKTAVGIGTTCPRWLTFIDQITDSDVDLASFLQRMTGYALTAHTHEHALFFLYGTGGNGKSVFLNTIASILKDYAKTSSMDVFTASNHDRHPTEVAMLQGARLVIAQETEEGRRWAENRIKSLTGGDSITARFMRQDFFTFAPKFKLIVAGNHKPAIRNIDPAIRRRFHLVPFTKSIPIAEQDHALPDKLEEEWSGILSWMIEGCLEWQKTGLCPPDSVRSATEEYFDAEDSLSLWLEECCTLEPDAFASSNELFRSWETYATRAGEHVGNKKRLSQALQDRGFSKRRDPYTGRGYLGIKVNHPVIEDRL